MNEKYFTTHCINIMVCKIFNWFYYYLLSLFFFLSYTHNFTKQTDQTEIQFNTESVTNIVRVSLKYET